MKRKLLAGVCVVLFGVSGMVYSDDTTVTLDGNTSNSGFSIKDSSGTSIARFQGDGKVGIGTTSPEQLLTLSKGGNYQIGLNNPDSGGGSWFIGQSDNAWMAGGSKLVFVPDSSSSGNAKVVFTNSGNVGIGTTAPSTKLQVAGTDAIGISYVRSDSKDARISVSDSTKMWSIASGWATAGDFSIIEEGVAGDRLYIQQGGNVGIGTSGPSYTLHVNGSAYSTGGWSGSDERWKKDVHPLENSLSNVLKLQGVSYLWKMDEYPEKKFSECRQIGLIAQDVEKVIPELVHTDNEGYKSVSYEKLTAVLVEAVKEQQKQIVQQQEQINTLREKDEKIAMLEKKLSELSETMNSAIQFASVK